jgi:hypothetical protein
LLQNQKEARRQKPSVLAYLELLTEVFQVEQAVTMEHLERFWNRNLEKFANPQARLKKNVEIGEL